MTKTKFLITVGLSVLAVSALAAQAFIVGNDAPVVQTRSDAGPNNIQPAAGKDSYDKIGGAGGASATSRLLPTVNKKTESVIVPPGDVGGDGTPAAAINNSHSNIKNLKTAAVTLRGWDPDKKELISGRIKAVTDADENIASAEVDTDKVEVQYRRPAKLLGFIPVVYYHAFTVDGKGNVAQRHPWWLAFAISDADTFGADVDHVFQHNQSNLEFLKMPTDIEKQSQIFSALTNILKSKHDASQAAINNTK